MNEAEWQTRKGRLDTRLRSPNPASASDGRAKTRAMWKLSTTIERMKTKKLPPVHPGEILLHDFMEPLGLNQSALAKAIGVTPSLPLHKSHRTAKFQP
jgi:hypothetical protein